MNASLRTAYAAVIAEADAKAQQHEQERAALDTHSRTYKRDYHYLTHLIESQRTKADRHRAIAEAKEQG